MPAPPASALIDWVDPADRPIGQVRRSEVFSRRAGFRVVHIFVFSSRGELLLQQLGRNRERNPLRWGSSVAGYLEAGEDYLDAATRRLREELGLTTSLAKFGSVVMPDSGARKFITLYLTTAAHVADSSQVTIAEPHHIESVRFEQVPEVHRQIEACPENFTETFLLAFRFFFSTLRLTGPNEWRDQGGLSVPSWNA
jgi:8-oxo-dGTP pyrophosphatase MutT (NUDIX family)